jgi:5S rRNA maturation endonuclease (ribonuclease M5)
VEGFNDVIGLDALGVPAVAVMSNAITEHQVAKVERWARQVSNGRVSVLFDADEAGDAGAKEALVKFAERGLDVRLGWSRAMHGGKFVGRQPETLMAEEWITTIRLILERA